MEATNSHTTKLGDLFADLAASKEAARRILLRENPTLVEEWQRETQRLKEATTSKW